MLNYTYRKSSYKWGKDSPDFSTFLFKKQKQNLQKNPKRNNNTSSSFLFCQQKASTVLNSDHRHTAQAFKGHLSFIMPIWT